MSSGYHKEHGATALAAVQDMRSSLFTGHRATAVTKRHTRFDGFHLCKVKALQMLKPQAAPAMTLAESQRLGDSLEQYV